MGAASLQSPFPHQNATETQLNVATVVGHWQPVIDFIDAGIEPGLPPKIRL